MALQDCFNNVVGITQNDCPCFDQRPEDWNESLSGYYIDDMKYGVPLASVQASKDCGDGNIWDIMDQARKDGVRDFLKDFQIAMEATNRKAFEGFSGPFANYRNTANNVLQNTKQYSGVRYQPLKWKGVSMIIRQLCIYMENDTPIEVMLYSSEDFDLPINSWMITPKARSRTCFTLPEEVNLPLSKDGFTIDYYFVYDSSSNRPMNLKFDCGCAQNSKPQMYKYLSAKGFQTDDLNDLENVNANSMYVNGIQPVGEITCDSTSWMCNDWDYWSDPFARVMANTIQFYSIIGVAGSVLNSGRINFYTLLNRESLLGRISSLESKIRDNIAYLIDNIPSGATDCMVCDSSLFRKDLIDITGNVECNEYVDRRYI